MLDVFHWFSGSMRESFRGNLTVRTPSEQRQIMADLRALQAEVEAPKRLQAETAADPPSSDSGATESGALLPAILDRTFKGEL
jgi:hypothetical protein